MFSRFNLCCFTIDELKFKGYINGLDFNLGRYMASSFALLLESGLAMILGVTLGVGGF